jgi:hypothetical protein
METDSELLLKQSASSITPEEEIEIRSKVSTLKDKAIERLLDKTQFSP